MMGRRLNKGVNGGSTCSEMWMARCCWNTRKLESDCEYGWCKKEVRSRKSTGAKLLLQTVIEASCTKSESDEM